MRKPSLTAAFQLLAALSAAAQNQAWIHQVGSSGTDTAVVAAPDGAGGMYAGGQSGRSGRWLARFDGSGSALWVHKFEPSLSDLAPDGANGVFVCGGGDTWVGRLDSAGTQLWRRRIDSGTVDDVWACEADGLGGVFVGGRTLGDLAANNLGSFDAWFGRYDATGQLIWMRQIGTDSLDSADALVPDGAGGLFVVGHTFGELGGPNQTGYQDIWLAHYDAAGSLMWIIQVGTPDTDGLRGVTAAPDGSGGLFVCADTFGSLAGPNSGWADVWLARYASTGTQLWSRQIGTVEEDAPISATSDSAGGFYLSGWSNGGFGGLPHGAQDIWLGRYDGAGNELWMTQFGGNADDRPQALATSAPGQMFLVGYTWSSLAAPNAGWVDAWLARYDG